MPFFFFFCLNSPMAMSCHSQKAHSPYPDPQGSSCLNCQLILDSICYYLLFSSLTLPHPLVLAKGFFWNCSTLGYLHGLLHKFCFFFSNNIWVDFLSILLKITTNRCTYLLYPLTSLISPHNIYIFNMLPLLLWMAPYPSMSSLRGDTLPISFISVSTALSIMSKVACNT